MPRERRVYRDLRRFVVAYLAHHNDVGVLAEHGPKPVRKGDPRLHVHLRLVHARYLVLDWVFNGRDIHGWSVQNMQNGIERRRLPVSRGTRNERDAIWLFDPFFHDLRTLIRKPKLRQTQGTRGTFKQSHFHLFSMKGRHHIHPNIHHHPFLHFEPESAVLRSAVFVNAQVGKHLDARDQNRLYHFMQRENFVQNAVHAITDEEFLLKRLEVYV